MSWLSRLDDKWNISESAKDAASVITLGASKSKYIENPEDALEDFGKSALSVFTLGVSNQYRKAEEADERAAAAATSANAARLGAQRTTNFRNMMKSAESTQQSAAELMNLAASGGFADSSAIMQSFSSGKGQQLETGKYYEELDLYGLSESNAMDAQRSAESRYNRNMTNVGYVASAVGSVAGGVVAGAGGAVLAKSITS